VTPTPASSNIILSGFNDSFVGDANAQTIQAGAGNDSIDAGDGDDTLQGGAGNDTLIGGAGADSIDGGAGTDVVDYSASSAGISINLGTGTGNTGGDAQGDIFVGGTIENAIGSAGDDSIIGSVRGQHHPGRCGQRQHRGRRGCGCARWRCGY
jgi:hypothetical protein